MTTEEVIEFLGRQDNAGEFPLDNTDPLYIRAMLPTLRSQAIRIAFNGDRFTAATKIISPQWYQNFQLTVDQSIQSESKEYIIINVPAPLQISTKIGGVNYFGREDAVNRFIPARSVSEIADFKARGYLNDGKSIHFVPISNTQYWVWGDKMLRRAFFIGVLSNPFEAPNWDEQTSDFPVDENVLHIMRRLYREDTNYENRQVVDNVHDGANTPELPVLKQATK